MKLTAYLAYSIVVVLAACVLAEGQISISSGAAVAENFNGIGTVSTATLPANWKMSAARAGDTAMYSTIANLTRTTEAANSGSPTTGGRYNWGTTAGTERAIGFMTSGSYASPNAIFAFYRNTSGRVINNITISFQFERYRVNQTAASVAFSSSTDGSTWTSRPTGNIPTSDFPTAASAYAFANPLIVTRNAVLTGVNIPNNGDFYLRWVVTNTESRNSQGLGLDDVSVTPSLAPATLTVNSTADPGDGTCDASECTLREAINAAISGDTIVFSPLFNTPQTINLGSTLQVFNKDLIIAGPGANLLTVDGNPSPSGVFVVGNSNFNLSGVKIQGGAASATGGGGVSVDGGRVVLDSVYITGNSAVKGGGVQITNTGSSTNIIRNSTISGNSVTDSCGGVRVTFTASLDLVNSTISGNNGSGTAGNGGGLCAEGAVTLPNSTITNNTAMQGGGIFVANTGTLDFGSTIVVGNTATILSPEIFQQIAGNITSSGFNLIGDSAGDAAATQTPITYQPTDILDTDPQLQPLGSYGGPTPTHALGSTSVALDAGFAFGQTTDQRGQPRTVDNTSVPDAAGGDGTDIGAYEASLGPSAARVTLGGRIVSANGVGLAGVRVILEGNSLEEPRVAISSSFGYFSFDGVEAGEGYILQVENGRRRFRNQSRFIMLNDELTDVDFVAEP